MPAVQSVAECKQDLIAAMTYAGAGQNRPEIMFSDSYLDDYAEICSFLTDRDRALAHLVRLNNVLLLEVNRRGMRKRGKFTGAQKRELRKADVTFTRHDGQTHTSRQYATQNVLASFLESWEQASGFNQGVTQVEGVALPPRSAELTAFVSGSDFRAYLLKHGYHWADIAVAKSHGDFTHRLHWYMICEEHKSRNSSWLAHEPVELFKVCGEPAAVNPNNKGLQRYTIWDQIVDNYAVSQDNPNSPVTGRDNGFRCPENLHGFLKKETTRKRKDLWVLAQIIYSRSERVVEVLDQKNLGAGAVDDTYRQFEQGGPDGVVLKGDKTGTGGPHPGTIMWQRLSSNQPLGWYEGLLA